MLPGQVMKPSPLAPVLVLGLLSLVVAWPLCAQDNVTIPKSRLEELERKEKELERLKGFLGKTNDANAQLQKANTNAAAKSQAAPLVAPAATKVGSAGLESKKEIELERLKAELSRAKEENVQLKKENEKTAAQLKATPAATPAATHVSPPLASLPPLKPDDVVEAMDLANYYQADAAATDQRYRRKKFAVRGEIVGFERMPFLTNYRILLKTTDRTMKVICELSPPEYAKTVFTISHGEQLVALAGGRRVPMVKVGDTVQIAGWCRGVSGSDVNFFGTDIKVAP